MSIVEIVKILTSAGIEQSEANAEVKMLIEHFCGYSAVDIVMGKRLDEGKLSIVKEKAQLRARTRMPIQQILGFAYFMGDKFKVSKDTLIPRDETEILARKAIDIINKNNLKSALDIGTGTGILACTIAKYTLSKSTALDVSDNALKIAEENIKNLDLSEKVKTLKSNLFEKVSEKYDLIVSNPPYIPLSEKATIQKEVTFDPDLALYTKDEKGLEFYEKISKNAKNYLNKNGYLLFEMGLGQSEDIKQTLEQEGYKNIQIEKDLAGIDRVIIAQI
ncbi:MAG: peptide chain release factor N(5)-glutamine methyltransferase [Candidatus Melainabacteria bacterium]|nr:MAG: peptide chain release factor N(5)-glutamine methyltransferase [Candidatus Melainabacteria bacterium]